MKHAFNRLHSVIKHFIEHGSTSISESKVRSKATGMIKGGSQTNDPSNGLSIKKTSLHYYETFAETIAEALRTNNYVEST